MNAYFAEWLPLIQSLGWTLLHFLWQGALIGLGYTAVRLLVPASHAEARYNAGLISLALIALCPPLTFGVIYPNVVAAAASAPASPLGTFVVTQGAAAIAAQPGAGAFDFDRMLTWLVASWFVGVAVMAWRAVRQWQALERIARQCTRPSSELERMLASLAKRFGLVRSIRVLISDRIDTPTLIGWVKPAILLPTAVALGFPRHHVELILAHELGHLRRYDHLVNLAQAVVETLLFYHPVVHWISRDLRNEREVCCDRLVLRLTQGEPREYAQTLASLEELRFTQPQLAVAATGGVLLDRVRRIIEAPSPRFHAPRPTLALSLLVAAAVVIASLGVLRPDRKDIDALAAGANALLERLPRPDAAFLLGVALREPPKWGITLSPPKLAPVVLTDASRAPAVDPVRAISVDALPPPSFGNRDEFATRPELGPVADVGIASTLPASASEPTLPTVSSEATAPSSTTRYSILARHLIALHMISPRYPDLREVKEPVRVDVQFSVKPDGTVYDVKALTADKDDQPFGESAEKAMQQWRFDSASVPSGQARFQQSFVFAKQSDVHHRSKAGDGEEYDCVRRTGSLVCRHPQEEEVALPLTIIEANKDGPYSVP